MKNVTAFFLIFTLFFIACKKDNTVTEPENPTTIIPTPPVSNITASLNGQVMDETGAAIAEVTVRVGSQMYLTDENGFFRFDDITMNELGTYIRFEKSGYFQGAKFVEPRSNMSSIIQAVLIEKTLTGAFQSASGASVTTPENAEVTFPNNAIRLENGGDYDGTVNVFAKWFDPTATDLLETMPGDLRASNQIGDFVQLATYGMLAVELESETGEALNLKEGQTATLSFPVPASLLNNAPATIPLWYFNETTGYWIEEGTATLEGNNYVGEVSHFSFWNCDAPFPLVQLTGNLEDKFGNPIAGYPVNILVNSNQLTGGSFTNGNGLFTGKVPKDEILTIRIYDFCGSLIYEQEIGPFSEDVTLPTIQIQEGNLTVVHGQLLDCDNNPLPNAYAHLAINGFAGNALADENGDFQLALPACIVGSELQVVGYDLDALKTSETYTFELTEQPFFDVGEIILCDDIVTYMNFTIEGESFSIPEPSANFDGSSFFIFGFLDDVTDILILIENPNMSGDYPINVIIMNAPTSQIGQLNLECGLVDEYDPSNLIVTLTLWEGQGGFVEGTFSGLLPDATTLLYQVSGDFRMKID